MKRFCSCFKCGRGIPEISCIFSLLGMGKGHFSVFFTFEMLDSSISKDIQANPCGFVPDNKMESVNQHVRFH